MQRVLDTDLGKTELACDIKKLYTEVTGTTYTVNDTVYRRYEIMKVLIVEDEKIIRNGLMTHPRWEKWGVDEVREASNADEALNILLSYEADIVCTDIRMPGMNGLQMCRIIKEKYPDIQFIILTGYDEKDYLKQAIEIGVVNYLEKPISILELKKAVEKIRQTKQGKQVEDKKQFGLEGNSYLAQQVKVYVENHYFDMELSVKEIAAYFSITPQHLSTVFKSGTGSTVGQYITEVRLREAKRLLAMPQYKRYEIAGLVGYKDSDYFTKVFKKSMGCTPKEYRGKHVVDE